MEEVCLSPKETVRITFLGDHKVGKTTFLKNNLGFSGDVETTIHPQIYFRDYIDGIKNIRFVIADIPGSRKNRNLGNHYLQNLDALVIAFDLDNPRSFYGLGDWIYYVKVTNLIYSPNKIPTILLGIYKGNQIVKHHKILDFAKANRFIYIQSNIEEPIEEIYRQIINWRLSHQTNNHVKIGCLKGCNIM